MRTPTLLSLTALVVVLATACSSASDPESAAGSEAATAVAETDAASDTEPAAEATADATSAAETQPTAVPPADGDYTIAYGSVGDADPLFRSVGTSLHEQAAAEGIEVLTFDNAFDPSTALSNTRLMIQQEPDLIIQWSPATANEAIAELINDAGIPCIALNVAIDGCPLFNLSNGRTGTEAGAAAAAVALERGWTPADTSVGLISISVGGPEVHQAIQNFYATFADEFGLTPIEPDEITFSTTEIGDGEGVQMDSAGTLDSAFEAMQQILQIVPEDRNLVVQTLNDDSARGALRAIDQAGRSDSTLIASSGADDNAIEELRSGESWVAEGDPSIEQWASYLLAMTQALRDGVELPELTAAPQVTLTQDNIDEYYDGTTSLGASPVPPESTYLEEYLTQS